MPTKTVKVVVHSDVCVTINSLNYKRHRNYKDAHEHVQARVLWEARSLKLIHNCKDSLSSLLLAQFTEEEIEKLCDKVINIVDNSEMGVAKAFEECFPTEGSKSKYRPSGFSRLGVIRIYSRENICFYNGKNWRKIKI